jgi:tRNA uridine 5-carbamoylmethylation protein Kti12
MRSAGETDEADVLYQRAMIKVGAARKTGARSPAAEGNLIDDIDDDDKASVSEQIAAVEDLLKKLQLIKREREKVLKDLKEKVRLSGALSTEACANHERRFTTMTSQAS